MSTILIVDDRESNRKYLTTLLGYGGHRLLEAADGFEALEAARAEKPDLVLTDILMPAMDGYEFVRQLRADPALAQIHVIFCTAHYHEHEANPLAKACGVRHILTKPCGPQEVLRVVNEALGITAPPAPSISTEDFNKEHARLLADKLTQKVEELTETNARLNALKEVGLQLASELDRDRMLERFCRTARELVCARRASVVLVSEDQESLSQAFCSEMETETVAQLRSPLILQAEMKEQFAHRRAFRFSPQREQPGADSACALLFIPIASPNRFYGWLCLQDKVRDGGFSEEDEQLVGALASLAGRIHENADLYAELGGQEELLRKMNSELEQRVVERTEQLNAANQELAAFSSAVAHDLRAPVRHIKGFSRILLDRYTEQLDADGKIYLEQMGAAARQMGMLIEDLLSLSRAGDVELRRAPLDLSAMAKETLDALREGQPDRRVEFQVEEGLRADADARLLPIALENLLGNAWKYTSKQPLARIEFGQMPLGDQRVFFVRDNGAGFDQTFAKEMFRPFRRLHSAQEFEGTGVGLATVQRIIQRHGGRVWAEGSPGEGATVYFVL